MRLHTSATRSARTRPRILPRADILGSRFNSARSNPNGPQSPHSHILSGLAGGGAVFLGGCLWYYFSGIKASINDSNRIISTLENKPVKSLPPPNQAISYLRNVTKSYVVLIPGATSYVDSTFDSIEELHNTHRKEVDIIILGAYADIIEIVKQNKSVNLDSGLAILKVLRKRGVELERVAGRVSSDAVSKHPKLRNAFWDGWNGVNDLGNRYGPEVKKIYENTTNNVLNTVRYHITTTSTANEGSHGEKSPSGKSTWASWGRWITG